MVRLPLLSFALTITLLALTPGGRTGADGPTLGLLVNEPAAYDGYTLFAPLSSRFTYLLNNDGEMVHVWDTGGGGMSVYLLPDGSLVRLTFGGENPTFDVGGVAGILKRWDWDGNLIWQYDYFATGYISHHDMELLPNGNFLIIAYELKSAADAFAAGRDPDLLGDGELWPLHVIEVQPTGPASGDIVWEWHLWDHLVQDIDPTKDNYGFVADHPELVDVNFFEHTRPATGEDDWIHTNSIDYDADLDQVLLSARHVGEIWIIDHSTTTAEAAGHAGGNSGKGGDLLYRWGNPQAYGAGDAGDQQLFLAHNSEWVEPGFPGDGNITIYNNGLGRPGDDYSEILEIEPPVDASGSYALTPGQPYQPAAPAWRYAAPNPTDFFSTVISGTYRLPNGNTLVCEGVKGHLFEVTPAGEIVWSYVNPVNADGPAPQGSLPGGRGVFRAYRYAPNYAGLAGRDLTPAGPVELNPDTDADGLLDFDEVKTHGTDPTLADTDGDQLSDPDEVQVHGTDAILYDTDGGGAFDYLDLLLGDPFDAADDPPMLAGDADGDGCLNLREVGLDQEQGGLRNPANRWDFYDVDGNLSIDLFNDVFAVVEVFSLAAGDAGYDQLLDRSPPLPGDDPWDLQAPDGTIDLFTDVFGVANQFGHDCA